MSSAMMPLAAQCGAQPPTALPCPPIYRQTPKRRHSNNRHRRPGLFMFLDAVFRRSPLPSSPVLVSPLLVSPLLVSTLLSSSLLSSPLLSRILLLPSASPFAIVPILTYLVRFVGARQVQVPSTSYLPFRWIVVSIPVNE